LRYLGSFFFVLSALLINACSTATPTDVISSPTSGAIDIPGVGTITPTPAFGTPTIAPTATETQVPTPEKTFKVCKEIENYKDCVITKEDAFGPLFDWAEKNVDSLVHFDESKVKPLHMILANPMGWPTVLMPDIHDGSINYSDLAEIPWQTITNGVFYEKGPNGVDYPYISRVVAFHVDGKNYPVIEVRSLWGPAYVSGLTENDSAIVDEAIKTSLLPSKSVFLPILTSAIPLGGVANDPVAERTFTNFPDMPDRISQAAGGNMKAISQRGIVLLFNEPGLEETYFKPTPRP